VAVSYSGKEKIMKFEGEIIKCPHCYSSSHGECERAFGDSLYSCPTCKKKAGVAFEVKTRVVCAVCGGKGKIWIGPTANESLGQLVESLNELTDKFGRIEEQQSEILSRLGKIVADGEK
jgi:DnaJ-class molecular chaperone